MIKIGASVVDIRRDKPRHDDKYFVDTNVWYWMGYTKASQNALNYQVNEYPNYVGEALSAGSTVYDCVLSFSELAHIIERNEREIFNLSNKLAIGTKQFRYDYPVERQQVITELENVRNLANSVTAGNTVEVNLTSSMVTQSLTRLKTEALDGYDVFMIEAILAQNISQVITDDADYGQVSGITVFTANRLLISEAKSQGKLLAR